MITGKSAFVRRKLCYGVLIFLTIVSLFPFFVLLVNATRSHTQIQKGFSAFFGTSFFSNLSKLLTNPNLPVLKALFNSVYVSFMAALFSTYFSAMTAYGVYMYNFKGRAAAFKLILAIMIIFLYICCKIKHDDSDSGIFSGFHQVADSD